MLSKFLDPKNDIAFKKIFGSNQNKDILIHFLNDILEFSGKSKIKEVEFLNTVQDAEIASKKQSLVDVLCKDANGVQYIVEMQVKPTQGFEKRAQYYAAKAYSRQINRGKEEDGKYSNLKAIIFIAIVDCIVFPKKKQYKSDHVILDKELYEHDLKDFSFTFIELPKFPKKKGDKLNNIIEKWCYFFKYADETSEKELERIVGSDLVIKQAYEALNQFNWSEKELIEYDQEIKRIWDNAAVEAAMIENAQVIGQAIGYAIGEAKGIAIGEAKIIKKMLDKGHSIEIISELTGVSIDIINKIKEN